MNQAKAVAVVCVLAVAVGSSTAFSTVSGPPVPETPEQIADPPDVTAAEKVTVQIVPEKERIQREDTAIFVVRISDVSESRDGVVLGLRTEIDDTEYAFESRHPNTQEIFLPPYLTRFDTALYVPTKNPEKPVHVPIALSGEPDNEKLPPGNYRVTATVLSNGFQEAGTEELKLDVICQLECRVTLAVQWILRHTDLIVGTLGLLIAFFGRKKIWAFLREVRRRNADIIGGVRRRDDARMERDDTRMEQKDTQMDDVQE